MAFRRSEPRAGRRQKGPDADIKIKSRPVVSDLLPLVTGEVDPRLDKLKQWIVNLDYLDIKGKSPDGNYRNLIQKVFDIIGSVAEGMKLTYKGVGGRKQSPGRDGRRHSYLTGSAQPRYDLADWLDRDIDAASI